MFTLNYLLTNLTTWGTIALTRGPPLDTKRLPFKFSKKFFVCERIKVLFYSKIILLGHRNNGATIMMDKVNVLAISNWLIPTLIPTKVELKSFSLMNYYQ